MPKQTKPKDRISKAAIDHVEVGHAALTNNIGRKMIYLLINRGALTPRLDTTNDDACLNLLAMIQRNRSFTRIHLGCYTKAERKELIENAGLSQSEVWIKMQLLRYQEKGIKVTSISLAAQYYSERLQKRYTSEVPDHALLSSIRKIRKSIQNQKFYSGRKCELPFMSPEEIEIEDLAQKATEELMNFKEQLEGGKS